MMEACILAINDDVIKGCIGKDYKRYEIGRAHV